MPARPMAVPFLKPPTSVNLGYFFIGKIKIIDFENFDNNTFNVVTELTYKNGEDEFRPDIILLINGMPLVFIEVKKPNNREGIIAEHNRIKTRFQNKKFKNACRIKKLELLLQHFSPKRKRFG